MERSNFTSGIAARIKKDLLRKFADTEAEAKVLREQIKEKQVLGPSSLAHGLTFGKLKHIFLSAQQKRVHSECHRQ